ncbi:MAG: pseudaminic acid cytidylyltransferase [Lamprobacter sp.]|uniref:pseudaminic acid cytidylyltransferase n=1 Tax=Lamprobacter sp. TaxID=3100796 RepID=UPI002B25E2A9|nr:pseudaminic acid cytidylyltransferase [Lamprobacter sp.]MEA3641707.1 pseudaminic acid cytidylyltransferase [Lamprobacter sp.]
MPSCYRDWRCRWAPFGNPYSGTFPDPPTRTTTNLCIIPARGGSKRIPRKNIRDFCGKPMMAWSIAAAQASALFEHIIVSTDDDEIAAVAEAQGAEVPFRRPAELANDHAGTTEVIAHATQWALAQGWSLEAVCCLYATAPFVQATDLQAGLQRLQQGDWAFCFTVTEFASPIFRAFEQTSGGGIQMFFPEQRQHLSLASVRLVDGQGTQRIVQTMLMEPGP